MSETIKVTVVEFGDRPHYQMQYVDPLTNRKKTRSTKIERTGLKRERTAAERVAATWEAELRAGRYVEPGKITWASFRERYENEVLTGLADGTESKVSTVFNLVESLINPNRLRELTAERMSTFQAELRKEYGEPERRVQRTETTIAGYLAHLQAALRWAEEIGLLIKAPVIKKPSRAKSGKTMKGRPITGEEFDRLLAKVEAVVGAEAAPSWIYYLRGLHLSGLRLTESLELYWDRDDRLCVDMTGRRPMLRIPAEHEKGNKDRLLPMAPEFAEFLATTPKSERTGRVFDPKPKRTGCPSLASHRVSELVSEIGKSAGVKVNTDAGGRVKFASAHDLRRSFGERWATPVMPAVLQQLMRHESIETTMKFYVGRNAANTADVLWEAHSAAKAKNEPTSNTSSNSDQLSGAGESAQQDATANT